MRTKNRHSSDFFFSSHRLEMAGGLLRLWLHTNRYHSVKIKNAISFNLAFNFHLVGFFFFFSKNSCCDAFQNFVDQHFH